MNPLGIPSFDRVSRTVFGVPVRMRRLRDCEREPASEFHKTPAPDLSPFCYLGVVMHLHGAPEPALWKENGRWREDDTPHPHDLAQTSE